jgi:D-alanyl-lipoteichoic acid acyltransferase DltB (MBOAT superfamily)
MLFNSFEFLIFLPVVFILYWFVFKKSIRYQNLLLVVASYVFYGWWDWRFLALIFFSTVTDYLIGIFLERSDSNKIRKYLLVASLSINLGILWFFKYYNFFAESLTEAFGMVGVVLSPFTLNIILPVGISFYTFQSLSYSIDIYRNQIRPTKDFVAFAAFICFFPQLVAGPIERASRLLPQFIKQRKFDYEYAVSGMRLILWGIFKKMVIADRLALFSNLVFNDYANYNGVAVVLATLFFTFQIYCDFSGYSDIAIGTSRLFGFNLMINFRMPYFSKSIKEFWSRWHISLSTWFRDYVYIPLGGNRVNQQRIFFNIMITFLVSGLWHGANWTFIIWGAIHGVVNVIESIISNKGIKLKGLSGVVKTFIIVSIAWIFFRANNVIEAFGMLNSIFDSSNNFGLKKILILGFEYKYSIALGLIFILFLLITEYLLINKKYFIINKPLFRRAAYFLLLLMFLFFGVFQNQSDFIYFQF